MNKPQGNVKARSVTLSGNGTTDDNVQMRVVDDTLLITMGDDVIFKAKRDGFDLDGEINESEIIVNRDTKFEGNVNIKNLKITDALKYGNTQIPLEFIQDLIPRRRAMDAVSSYDENYGKLLRFTEVYMKNLLKVIDQLETAMESGYLPSPQEMGLISLRSSLENGLRTIYYDDSQVTFRDRYRPRNYVEIFPSTQGMNMMMLFIQSFGVVIPGLSPGYTFADVISFMELNPQLNIQTFYNTFIPQLNVSIFQLILASISLGALYRFVDMDEIEDTKILPSADLPGWDVFLTKLPDGSVAATQGPYFIDPNTGMLNGGIVSTSDVEFDRGNMNFIDGFMNPVVPNGRTHSRLLFSRNSVQNQLISLTEEERKSKTRAGTFDGYVIEIYSGPDYSALGIGDMRLLESEWHLVNNNTDSRGVKFTIMTEPKEVEYNDNGTKKTMLVPAGSVRVGGSEFKFTHLTARQMAQNGTDKFGFGMYMLDRFDKFDENYNTIPGYKTNNEYVYTFPAEMYLMLDDFKVVKSLFFLQQTSFHISDNWKDTYYNEHV